MQIEVGNKVLWQGEEWIVVEIDSLDPLDPIYLLGKPGTETNPEHAEQASAHELELVRI